MNKTEINEVSKESWKYETVGEVEINRDKSVGVAVGFMERLHLAQPIQLDRLTDCIKYSLSGLAQASADEELIVTATQLWSQRNLTLKGESRGGACLAYLLLHLLPTFNTFSWVS